MARAQVSTFAVNYKGRPFMQSLAENKPLRNSLFVAAAVTVACASSWFGPFNAWLELVPFPSTHFRNMVCLFLLADVGGAWLWDRLVQLACSLPRQRHWTERLRHR
eukprot:tig00000806_g4340.t1